MSASPISAVIETINVPPGDHAEILSTLEGLAAQTIGRDRIEVIVVLDPAVHPDLPPVLQARDAGVRIVAAPGAGYYAQKNAGARAATADVVAFIDSDNTPVPGWAESILRAFAEGGERIGAAQGVLRASGGPLAGAFQVSIFPALQTRHDRECDSIGASNVAFRREDIITEPWDEDPIKHGPDIARAAAIRRRGRVVLLVAGAETRHAYVDSVPLFLQRGVYWGYCFVQARRSRPAGVRYAALTSRLSPLMPLLLGPAKAVLDIKRLFARRDDLGLKPSWIVWSVAVLLANGVAVSVGALLAVLRRAVPASPY